MAGNIVGEPFDKFVYDQVGVRQSVEFSGYKGNRTPEQIQYLNNVVSWAKLASGVSIEDSDLGRGRSTELMTPLNQSLLQGSALAKQSILFGGLSSQIDDKKGKFSYYIQRSGIYTGENVWNKSYSYGVGGRDFGIQPVPGIFNVNIDCVNRGSIRTAEVTLKAYNRFQFELIELLYLRIGYTMMLEWGNNQYLDNQSKKLRTIENTIIEDVWFNNDGISQLEMIQKIREYREQYQGNYDGFMGKVRNFTWSFEADGSYNISIDLVTVGDVVESLQVNLPISQTERVNLLLDDSPDEESTSLNEIDNVVQKLLYEIKLQIDKEVDNNDFISLSKLVEENEKLIGEKNYYITFQQLLAALERIIIPVISAKNQNEGVPVLSFDTDEKNNLMCYNINQVPLDPNICVFKFDFSSSDPGVNRIKTPEAFKQLKEFVVSDNNASAGQIMHLYLNFNFIEKCLKQNIDNKGKLSLFKFLTNICNGINSSLANTTKLEPVIREDNIVTIIDQNPIPGLIESTKVPDLVPLEIYGYNLVSGSANFVKDISLETSITPDMATMVSIGATAAGGTVKGEDATAFSKWNDGLEDRFNEKTEVKESSPLDLAKETAESKKEWIANASKEWDNADGFFGRQYNSETFESVIVRLFYDREPQKQVKNKYICNTAFRGFKSGYLAKAEKCFDKKKQQLEDNEKQRSEELNNYILYLVQAFGGSSILIGNNKVAPTVSKEKAQYFKFDNVFIARGKSSYKEYLRNINDTAYEKSKEKAKTTKEIFASNQIGFIPINLRVTLKGISGIKIYNKLSINQKFLPKNYPEALHFVITKVNHQITNNVWETQLDTISMPVTSNTKLELAAPTYTFNPDEVEKGPIPPTKDRNRFRIVDLRETVRFSRVYPAVIVRSVPNENKDQFISIPQFLEEINPAAKEAFRKFISILSRDYPGYTMKLNAIGRSFKRSAELQLENSSNASPGRSKHNYYAAIDFNIVDPNGVTYMKDGNRYEWVLSGIPDVAKSCNLDWGGDFKNYEDCIHFSYPFDIDKAYEKAEAISIEENIDINEVDGYTISLS